jgi:hypothetical protein
VQGVYGFVWVPRFLKNYFHLMKLPAGVQIRILLQEFKGDDEITRQEVNFVT